MKLRAIACVSLFVLIAGLCSAVGMAIDQAGIFENGLVTAEQAVPPRVFGTSDCTFFQEGPRAFIDPGAGHRALLSETTQMVSEKTGHPTGGDTGSIVRRNFIDNFIFNQMQQDGVPPAAMSTDEEFLRRVTLDLTGRIPTSTAVRNFLANTSTTKRDDVINTLLQSPEFVDRWTMFFGDLFKNTATSSNVNRFIDGRTAFYTYLKNSISQNKPYDQIATDLIVASGDSYQNGPVNFVVGGTVPMGPVQDTYDGQLVQTANVFLGINVFDCLLCHNGSGHLDQINVWGATKIRMDGWHMSAFYSRTQMQNQRSAPGSQIQKWFVSDRASGNYPLGTTSGNRVARIDPNGATSVNPLYIFSGKAPASGENFRVVLAKNLTGDIQFARAAVNYLWAHFFGMGMVDPPNTFDLARLDPNNPPPAPWSLQPTHPELLQALAQEFIASGFDLRHIMRLITGSSAYQLSSNYDPKLWQDAYIPYFARHFATRLDAEEIHDALTQATNVSGNYTIPTTFNGTSYNTTTVQWAMQLPDTTEPTSNGQVRAFLNTFLRGDRDTKPRSTDPSILQALSLMNNNVVISRIHFSGAAGASNTVSKLVSSGMNNSDLLDELFLSTLNRFPTNAEKSALMNLLNTSTNRASTVEDIQWTLLNKVDFIYNH
ncbi:MAG: DUF1553 domain-containing protein [Acidobacteriia bacterium]|nr:DUF1553 domain-containing protein [Terriglobia bacterium]